MSDIKVPQELSKETPDENVQQEQPQVPPPRQQDDATLIEESSKENEVTSALVVVPSDEERKRKNVDDSTKVEEVEVEAITTIENQVEAVENSNSHRDETNEDSDDDDESDSEPKKQTSALPPRPIKRARTAYFIFTDEKRPVVQAEHPGEGVATVARIMGQMWSSLSAEEKEKYQRQAAQERDRVAKELQDYKDAGGIVANDTETKSSKDSATLIYPLARIRKICKLDPEVRGVSKEAMLLITKCAELATAKLGQETVRVAQLQNRRKLLPEDVAQVCSNREQFLFLKDDIKDLVKETLPNNKPSAAVAKKGDSAKDVAAVGSKPLTSYFGAVSK